MITYILVSSWTCPLESKLVEQASNLFFLRWGWQTYGGQNIFRRSMSCQSLHWLRWYQKCRASNDSLKREPHDKDRRLRTIHWQGIAKLLCSKLLKVVGAPITVVWNANKKLIESSQHFLKLDALAPNHDGDELLYDNA